MALLLNLPKIERPKTISLDRTVNPNKLPFLQVQILQRIYLDLFEQRQTALEDLAELTDYPKDSKILKDAIDALVRKDFLEGDLLKF